ncbi:hypothetical protein [Neobacillus mesonae]|uniref:Uncharacterized protein n=1 Tax=Neobacillus mesonae TaxID=1193713 RepID=A0A3T0I4H6_9BACI|nr:hypothetical protein [Neobacillus mesonae]AZU64259.1 hypothetical protein CHR53_25145 [Neobacillus mesonae]MED4203665.1 hypothetical protein [Neobacillus mesonae]
MFKNFEVKTMFKGLFHECQQFKINIKGKDYAGLFKAGEIQWFHPHPKNKLKETHLSAIELKVQDLLN